MKGKFSKSEALYYLEEQLKSDTASEFEEEVYLNYRWFNDLGKNTYALKQVLKNMRKEYDGE